MQATIDNVSAPEIICARSKTVHRGPNLKHTIGGREEDTDGATRQLEDSADGDQAEHWLVMVNECTRIEICGASVQSLCIVGTVL